MQVRRLEPREGGALEYEMIADAPETIAAMKGMGRPASHLVQGTYAGFRDGERLTLVHIIDFLPGVAPYETRIDVDFTQAADGVRMIVTLHPHLDPHWTRMSAQGFASQLTKLDRRYGVGAP